MEMTTHHTMQMYARNSSYVIPGVYDIELQDAGWILVASIIIFRCVHNKRHVCVDIKIIDTVMVEKNKALRVFCGKF